MFFSKDFFVVFVTDTNADEMPVFLKVLPLGSTVGSLSVSHSSP